MIRPIPPGTRDVLPDEMRELRAIDPEVRVVIMSGYAFAEVPSEEEAKKTPFLRKPFTVGELRRTIGASLAEQ